MSQPVKKFLESFSIWKSYEQNYSVVFEWLCTYKTREKSQEYDNYNIKH